SSSWPDPQARTGYPPTAPSPAPVSPRASSRRVWCRPWTSSSSAAPASIRSVPLRTRFGRLSTSPGPSSRGRPPRLSSPTRAVFVPTALGDYHFQLVVTDSSGAASFPAAVTVQVRSKARPAAPALSISAAAGAHTVSFAQPAQIVAAGPPAVTLSVLATGDG